MPFDRTKYMGGYMRKERAWAKGAEAVMRLPPKERFNAAQELWGSIFHDEIVRDLKYQTALQELLGRIRQAPDAVPFFEEYMQRYMRERRLSDGQ